MDTNNKQHWEQYRKTRENHLNKPLIIFTFIVVLWLGAISGLNEKLHFNEQLNAAFSNAGFAETYAKIGYYLLVLLISPIVILWIKGLWNNLIPRITKWNQINFWEAMGITALILFFALQA